MSVSVSSVAGEYRCGWLENPTPANWWLTDKDKSWVISTQGGYSIKDKYWDNLPEIEDDEFVKTNIHYGYSCACLTVTTDAKKGRILKILKKGKQLLLKRCLEDVNLSCPK